MSIKAFLQELEKGLKSPGYFLYAANPHPLDDAASAIKKTLPEAERDLNFNVFDSDPVEGASTPEEIKAALNTISFLGGRSYIIVKNIQKLPSKDLKKFQDYLSNPSPDAVLVMLYRGELKKDVRESLKGMTLICLDIREQDLPFWIKEKAKQKGITLNDEAVEYLLGTIGNDTGLLASEIEKLSLLGKESISINSMREIVEGSRDYSVFDLTDALRKKDSEKVFRIYKALSETLEPQSLLGAINWQYSRMQAYSNEDDRQKNRHRKVFELLHEADLRIKSSGGVYPMEYLLVRLLRL